MFGLVLAMVLQSGPAIEKVLIENFALSRVGIQVAWQAAVNMQSISKRREVLAEEMRLSRERSAALRQRVDEVLRDRAKKAAEAQEPDLPK